MTRGFGWALFFGCLGLALSCFALGMQAQKRFGDPKIQVVEEIESPDNEPIKAFAALPIGTEIRVGRIKPGTEDDEVPVRSEWKTAGEWSTIVQPGITWYISPQNGRLYIVCNSPDGSRIPAIEFGGVSNIVYLKPGAEFGYGQESEE